MFETSAIGISVVTLVVLAGGGPQRQPFRMVLSSGVDSGEGHAIRIEPHLSNNYSPY